MHGPTLNQMSTSQNMRICLIIMISIDFSRLLWVICLYLSLSFSQQNHLFILYLIEFLTSIDDF